MAKQNTTKKHIVTSFHNLTPELQDAVKEKYLSLIHISEPTRH